MMKALFAALAGWVMVLGSALASNELLDPVQAFHASAAVAGPNLVEVNFQIAPGYYMYRKKLHFISSTAALKLGKPDLPGAEMKKDEFFGVMEIYRGKISVLLPVRQPTPAGQVAIRVQAQGCAEAIGACYPAFEQLVYADFPPLR